MAGSRSSSQVEIRQQTHGQGVLPNEQDSFSKGKRLGVTRHSAALSHVHVNHPSLLQPGGMSKVVAARPHFVVRPSFSPILFHSHPPPREKRLLISAGKAAPTPPVGPALGARGVRSMDFCKEFNARTAHISPGVPIPTVINIQPDRSFTFVTKTPTVSYFLKKAACIEKGTGRPGHETVGTVNLKHVYEIAKIKATDEHLKHLGLEAIASTIIGSARTLGVRVVP
jgi:large subunit ribosomal protein L11